MPKKKKYTIEKAIKKLVKQYIDLEGSEKSSTLHQELIQRVERSLIHNVLKKTQYNQSQTARILGISRTTLRKKMKELGLFPPSEKD